MAQNIPVKLAEPGMVLAKAVRRNDGMVLLGEGMALTETAINRIRSSNIYVVSVRGKPLPWLAGGNVLEKMHGRIDYLFRRYEGDSLMWTLRNMIAQHVERRLEEERALAKVEQVQE